MVAADRSWGLDLLLFDCGLRAAGRRRGGGGRRRGEARGRSGGVIARSLTNLILLVLDDDNFVGLPLVVKTQILHIFERVVLFIFGVVA